jgi:dTDP-4-amino-4,6-dideoxygalactose transaminase
MSWSVPLADLNFGPEEEQAVLSVVRSKWLTMGEITQHFEAEFAQFTGAKHAIAVSNATVALHLACLAAGLGPGDEAIVPSLSFVATSNAVLYTGAEVRFAEVNGPDDLTISPQSIESQITPRTKAIVVMHYGGYPCRMPEILEIATKHTLKVIEDAAHSPGASLAGKHLGTWGNIGCFSFFSNKNLSTGEGGMVVTDDDELAAAVRLTRSHGMTSLTWDRHQGHAHSYDVTALGYNYRIDEIRAALGRVQLQKLEEGNARRREITQHYWKCLAGSPLTLPFSSAVVGRPSSVSSAHLFPVLLTAHVDRDAFMEQMKAADIQTSIHYPPIHTFSYYRSRYPGIRLAVTEDIASRLVTLPLFPTMSDGQVDLVTTSAIQALKT